MNGKSNAAMDAHESKILIATSLTHYLTHFFILIFPALVMPISRDLGLSPGQVISLSFPMYLCYGVLAIPWGYLSDRFNPRFIMGAGLLVAGVGFITAGQARTIVQLTVFFAFIGAGCSAYHPSGLALLSMGIRQRGKALGINGLFGNLGIASAPLVAGVLCYTAGWRTALAVLGGTALASGFFILAVPFSVTKDRDLQKGTLVDEKQAAGLFLLLCCAMLFSGLMYRGFTVILPTFMEAKLSGLLAGLQERLPLLFKTNPLQKNVHTLIATIITSGVFFIGMAGQLFGGHVADRRDLRWAYFTFFVCALPFLILLSFLNGFYLVLSAGCFAFFSLGMQPIENSLIAMVTPPRWRSVSYGIKFTIVFGAGALSVYLVSFVQGHYGLNYVILLLTGYLSIMLLIIVVMLLCSRTTSIRHEKD